MRRLVVALVFLVSCPVAVSAQSVTLHGSTTVKSAQDFATLTFQDPWDMNEWTDVGAFLTSADQPASGLSNVSLSGGRLHATNANGDPNFFLLDTGNPNAASLGKNGTNYPIAAGTYRLLAFRMTVPAANQAQVIWWSSTIYQSSPNVLGNIATTAGDRTYFVNLSTLTAQLGSPWGGTVRALRFDPANGGAGQQMSFDWFRLVNIDSSLCRQVTWTRGGQVDVYLDTDTNATNGNHTLLARNVTNGSGTASAGCSAASTGHTFYAGALAPGTYYVAVATAGAANPTDYSTAAYTVNAIPTVQITTPSEEGSDDDYATTVLGNAWDMDQLADFDRYTNVTGQTITTIAAQTEAGASLGNVRVMRATSMDGNSDTTTGTPIGDPYVHLLYPSVHGAAFRIDPTKYRILTIEFGQNRTRDIANGSVARIVWRVAGNSQESVSDDIIFNSRPGANVVNKLIVDMADRSTLPIEQGSTAGWVPGSHAVPGIDILRFDPHEFTPATSFFVRRARLAALERLGPSTSYQITFVKSEAGATARVYWDSDRNPASGRTLIGTTTGNSVKWTTPTPSSARNYYIYVEVDDGTNTNGTYAKWPVIVDPNLQPLQSLTLNRSALNFGVMYGASRYTTPAQQIRMDASGVGPTPCWQVDTALSGSVAQYLSVTPTSGTGSGSFTVSVVGSPPVGTLNGTIRVQSCEGVPGFQNSPRLVPVTIRATRSSRAAFGNVDSPLNGAVNVSGSIAVTGWALDDVAVAAVKIYRSRATEIEGSGGLIYVGDAVLVTDARPDLEAAYATTPLNYRAGWGYLLLTNMLPDRDLRTGAGGNGVFTLYAYADDVEGNRVLLGSRTITLNNRGATRPFGAIDTPAQGATVSGIVNNFGWALTQSPKTIPSDGSTIQVVIDGEPVGRPGPLAPRSDIVSLFSGRGYNDMGRHVGVFALDTTELSNGVHTIAWGVSDSGGQVDGIGSRYFTVQNGGSLVAGLESGFTALQATRPAIEWGSEEENANTDPRSAPDLGAPVRVRTGFDLLAPLATVSAAKSSPRLISAREMERIELHLDADAGPGATYRGYLETSTGLRPLPIGSRLDRSRGVFTWQPGVGFIGDYHFVFTRADRGVTERIPVRIRLEPAHRPPETGSNVLMAIDLPRSGQVNGTFVVAGWAIDKGSIAGPGVDAVHVWAYPIVNGAYATPVFLGAANYGDARPDVAAYYGAQFTWSAFGLIVPGLPPGTYDIAAFARSALTRTFAPARVVRVTVR